MSASSSSATSKRGWSMMHAIDIGVWPHMWIFLLEAGVALGLLFLIVWWTWPRSEKKDRAERK
jgi:hypothetical protein